MKFVKINCLNWIVDGTLRLAVSQEITLFSPFLYPPHVHMRQTPEKNLLVWND